MGARGPQAKDQCRQGHDLTDENIIYEGTKRRCRECKRARDRRHYHNNSKVRLAYKHHYVHGDPQGRSWQEIKLEVRHAP